jgi:hypothetical protein
MTTGTARITACQAASEPAKPPPMMWMGSSMTRFYTINLPSPTAVIPEFAKRGTTRGLDRPISNCEGDGRVKPGHEVVS